MRIEKLEGYYKNEQAVLTRKLVEASVAYYGGETPIMSDLEFDREVERLRKMEEESGVAYDLSPTQFKVGAEVVTELAKAKHEQPALSLDKVKYKDRENLVEWVRQSHGYAIVSWKLDGLTLVLTYDGGQLTSAVTRGNGEEGSVVTHNARFFKGIPHTIDYTGHLVIRGEALMTTAEFERVNAEAGGIYENARNLAAATIQMLDANESRKREITFKAFELVSPEPERDPWIALDEEEKQSVRFMDDRLRWLMELGFDVVDFETVYFDDVSAKIEEWKERLPHLPYPTDGLVFTYNDLYEGWRLGTTGHHPRWAMALKWTDETVTTTIRKVEWSVGKTGVITPVAVFDEVRLGLGSNVTRASLHNLSYMMNMPNTGAYREDEQRVPLMIGQKAEVYLANLIIPQLASVEYVNGATPVLVPTKCPVCGEPTQILTNNDVQTLHCVNNDCPAQQVGKLMNTFSKDGLFVKGLGESQLHDLLNVGLVNAKPYSFYRLRRIDEDDPRTKESLMAKEGWGQKKWDNLLDAIDASRGTTLQKFLYSLNIPLLGNDLAKKLALHWHGDVEEFRSFVKNSCFRYDESFAELCAINGAGEEKAKNVVGWARTLVCKSATFDDFDRLIGELTFPMMDITANAQTLAGLTFVITGNVHDYKNRDEFKASVEARGGKVAGSVSAKTTALVNNDVTSTSGKNEKAKELGIEIISEDEFIRRYGK